MYKNNVKQGQKLCIMKPFRVDFIPSSMPVKTVIFVVAMRDKLSDCSAFRKISKVQKLKSYSLFTEILLYFLTVTSFIMTCNYVIYTESGSIHIKSCSYP